MDAYESLPHAGVGRSVEGIAKTAVCPALACASRTPLMEAHPAAEFFPLMGDAEFEKFKLDIAEQGLNEPIWLHDGKILDGRNRYRACIALGITPLFRDYVGTSPVAFAWSQNGERRQLTHGQKAAIAVEMLPALMEEAKQRQLTGLKKGQAPVIPSVGERGMPATDEAGAIVGVSGSSVQQAKALKERDLPAFEKLKAGLLRVGPAYDELQAKVSSGDAKPPHGRPAAVRVEAIRNLVKEGHRRAQIAEVLGLSEERVSFLARREGITLPDAAIGHHAKISITRVIEESVSTLEGVALGLKTINGARLECAPHVAVEWVKSIDASMRTIGKLKKALRSIT